LENRDNRINEQDAQRQRAELYFNETVVELNMKIARLEGRVESSSSSKPTTNNLTTNNNSHSNNTNNTFDRQVLFNRLFYRRTGRSS
jgi:hypothetical protein